MIKLQLLPDYVFEGEKIVRAVILCTVILALIAGASLYLTKMSIDRLEDMKKQVAAATSNKAAVDGIQAQISAAEADVAPINGKRDYMISLREYADAYVEKFRGISGYLYGRAEAMSASITEGGFSMAVRVKTTEDIARVMMNLRRAETDGLLAPRSIQVSGVTGWPHATGQRGWGTEAQRRMDPPGGISDSDLSPVNSNSRGLESTQAGGGGGAGGFGPGAPGAGPLPGGSGDAGAGGPGGGVSAGPGLAGELSGPPGAPGAAGGGGTGGGFGNFVLDFGRTSKKALQMLLSPRDAAMLEYIEPSDDPPNQPYLFLQLSGTWAVPIVQPQGTEVGGQGGFGGGGGFGPPMGGSGMMPPMGATGSSGMAPMPGATGTAGMTPGVQPGAGGP